MAFNIILGILDSVCTTTTAAIALAGNRKSIYAWWRRAKKFPILWSMISMNIALDIPIYPKSASLWPYGWWVRVGRHCTCEWRWAFEAGGGCR
jgi:hypothetical protein